MFKRIGTSFAIAILVLSFSFAVGFDLRAEETGEDSVMLADFEGWPNNLGGDIGVYGSLEPDWDMKETVPYSWVYEPVTPGYNSINVHDGNKSMRLVNALGTKPNESWGSFAMDMGQTIDTTVTPKKVESFDASGFKYLTFWYKGAMGGEKIKVIMRDSHALSYMPQYEHPLPPATTEWEKVVVPLAKAKKRIDLNTLDNVGISFGVDLGNRKGAIVYLDTFMFTNSE
ncbi:MAG: hypothetical protein JW800_02460 [Candidatus Omnitrophica bacterium]|nr:hypothetical protein [Candidatus Omnitrophota bacterium]